MTEAAQALSRPGLQPVDWQDDMRIEPPAIYRGLPNGLYHRGPGISKSGLARLRRSPLHYRTEADNPRPETPAMQLGTAFHTIILEPDRFDAEFVPDPAPGQYTKAAKELREQLRAEGKTVIPAKTDPDKGIWGASDWDTLHRMRDAVMTHPIAGVLLDPDQCAVELSAYWRDRETKELCKCRPDAINTVHNLAVDLKSTIDAAYGPFARSVVKYDYHMQDAFYRDGLREAGYSVQTFVFVAVEKEPPYAIGTYTVQQSDRELGRQLYRGALRTFHECTEADEWPAYDTDVRDLILPAWARTHDIM